MALLGWRKHKLSVKLNGRRLYSPKFRNTKLLPRVNMTKRWVHMSRKLLQQPVHIMTLRRPTLSKHTMSLFSRHTPPSSPMPFTAMVWANDFTLNTAIPYTQWAWTTASVFLDRTVWPKVRILYGENVEPQLVRIGERLGRYRDGKKLKAVIDEVDRLVSCLNAKQGSC